MNKCAHIHFNISNILPWWFVSAHVYIYNGGPRIHFNRSKNKGNKYHRGGGGHSGYQIPGIWGFKIHIEPLSVGEKDILFPKYLKLAILISNYYSCRIILQLTVNCTRLEIK